MEEVIYVAVGVVPELLVHVDDVSQGYLCEMVRGLTKRLVRLVALEREVHDRCRGPGVVQNRGLGRPWIPADVG